MVAKSESRSDVSEGGAVLTVEGIKHGISRLMPISIFVIPFGIAFGVAATDAGLSSSQAVAMSALAFSGAAQFGSLEFWPSPIAFGSLAFVVLALNARHIVMGAALAPWIISLPFRQRLLCAAFLSDANFADAHSEFKKGERDVGILLGGGFIFWIAWIAGTAIGAIGGNTIVDPKIFGIDVVMVCFFAAVVAGMVSEQTFHRRTIVITGSAVSISMITIHFLPTGWNVIAGALTGGVVAAMWDG